MNVAAFAIILLSSSYIWLRRWQLSRSHLLRTDGHAMYFLVVAAAVPVGAWTATVVLGICAAVGHPTWIDDAAKFFFASILAEEKNVSQVLRFGLFVVVSIVVAPVLAWILNFPIVRCSTLTARLLLRLGSVAELERFLWTATERGLAVMVTTDSGKVYVGNSVEMPTPGHDKKLIRLEPILSGYRDAKQDFVPTTSYLWAMSLADSGPGLRRKDFDVVLPVDKICSVHSFDLDTYVQRYHRNDSDAAANADTAAPRSTVRDEPREKATKGERFYWGFVTAVAITPTLIAMNEPYAAVAVVVLGTICGFASAIDTM